MLTLSKPISAGQAQAYHKSEFANAKENYYTEGERVRGEWQGQLAERYGLHGEVNEEQFARLSEGQHPQTGEALIRRQQAHEYVNAQGETVRAMEAGGPLKRGVRLSGDVRRCIMPRACSQLRNHDLPAKTCIRCSGMTACDRRSRPRGRAHVRPCT